MIHELKTMDPLRFQRNKSPGLTMIIFAVTGYHVGGGVSIIAVGFRKGVQTLPGSDGDFDTA